MISFVVLLLHHEMFMKTFEWRDSRKRKDKDEHNITAHKRCYIEASEAE